MIRQLRLRASGFTCTQRVCGAVKELRSAFVRYEAVKAQEMVTFSGWLGSATLRLTKLVYCKRRLGSRV